jgi:CHASE3 domain sensor protein
MKKLSRHPVKNKVFFIFCYGMLLLLVSFVVYLEYQWYTASNELPELVLNLEALTLGY